jgi:hypothetical protein
MYFIIVCTYVVAHDYNAQLCMMANCMQKYCFDKKCSFFVIMVVVMVMVVVDLEPLQLLRLKMSYNTVECIQKLNLISVIQTNQSDLESVSL